MSQCIIFQKILHLCACSDQHSCNNLMLLLGLSMGEVRFLSRLNVVEVEQYLLQGRLHKILQELTLKVMFDDIAIELAGLVLGRPSSTHLQYSSGKQTHFARTLRRSLS